MSSTLSDLALNKVQVTSSLMILNDKVDYSVWKKQNKIEIEIMPELGVNTNDPSSGRLLLEVELFDEDFIEKENPFYLAVSMEFYFEDPIGIYGDKEKYKDVVTKYGPNMVSMGYPYIRSYISTLTSISGISQVNIPTVNVMKMLKEAKAKQ